MKKSRIVLDCFLGFCALTTLFFVGMFACSCKSRKATTKTYTISEEVENITILTDTVDLSIQPSTDGETKVVCEEYKKEPYKVTVQEGTLCIEYQDLRKWYEKVGTGGPLELAVYLPEGQYKNLTIDESTGDIAIAQGFTFENIDISLSTGDVECSVSAIENMKIEVSTGDIDVKNITAKSVEITTTTGDIDVKNITAKSVEVTTTTGDVSMGNITASSLKVKTTTGAVDVLTANVEELARDGNGKTSMSDVRCKNFATVGNTGYLTMTNLVAEGKISIERSTGDVQLNACDAAELEITTSTGDVQGSLLTPKMFTTNTSTGKVDVPDDVAGGTCKVTTSTGDIKIEIKAA